MSLFDLKEKESGLIESFCSSVAPQSLVRLEEIGFFPGTLIQCLKIAPFKGPRVYKIADSVFSLDINLVKFIQLEKKL